MIPTPSALFQAVLRTTLTPCLIGMGALLACSVLPAQAQYADWTATPPKILPNEGVGSGAVFVAGSGRQYPNAGNFAALKADGSITAWGSSGGTGVPTGSGYTAIYSTYSAFAALKSDGSITAWGNTGDGGSGAPTDGGYKEISSTPSAFAALKADGSVAAWGRSGSGGSGAPMGGGYTAIYSNPSAFAALKADGSITAWGGALFGGSGAPNGSGYTTIYPTNGAFAALKTDGSITAWGGALFGGTGAPMDNGYVKIFSASQAFAAMKADGSIRAWGDSASGGGGAPTGSGYTTICSTQQAFAALRANGSIVVWGWVGDSAAPTDSGYTAICSNERAFAALRADGSITAWGAFGFGGSGAPKDNGYIAIYSNVYSFAALKADGSITAWGNSQYGGSGAPVGNGYTAIYSTSGAFAALNVDGSIKAWGYKTTERDDLTEEDMVIPMESPPGSGFHSIQSVSYHNLGAVVTAANSGITSSTASVSGEVVREGKSSVTERGFVYALVSVSDPKIGNAGVTQVIDGGSGLGSFSTVLTGLTPNTPYILKSYVINEDGPTYSSGVNFSTNLRPVILSNGGNSNVALSLAENSNSVTTISASDEDADQTIGYSIGGGVDAARFSIGAASGVLTFVTAPDYEAPGDANADNVYEVIVKVTDNGSPPKSATQTLTITVTNLIDNGGLALEQPAGTALANDSSLDFGGYTIGQATELTFTLRSEGEADLRLPSGLAISGAGAGDFSLIGSVPSVLSTSNSVTFSVRFTPSSSGARAASLSIPTNDTRPGRSPYILNLTGTGNASAIVATYSNAANQVRGGWINGTNFTIGTVNTHWNSGESPDKAVDSNAGTKFLLFRNNNVGLILSPTNSSVAFNRLALYTANDASERDPASYVIYGSSTLLTGTSGTNLPLAGLTQLASGTIVLPDNRSTGPTVVQFANTTPYASYIVAFPTVRSTSGNNLTQISEVQLSQGINPSYAVAMTGARGGQLSSGTFNFGSIGNSNPGTNWKAEESPDQAIDGSVSTKYLTFRSSGAGLIASPQAGPAQVNRLSFWTSNDSSERDPLTYEIYGFATAVTSRSGTLNVATSGTLLGSGTLALPATRSSGPETVSFANSMAYASYLVVFPTVKNSPSTTMTQIAEVQFGYNGAPEFNLPQSVAAWGWNAFGQSTVPAGLRGVTSVAAAYGHSLALKKNGTVAAWGWNAYGQTTVPAGLAGVTSIAAGDYHSAALKSDGTLAVWGGNNLGQLNVPSGLSGLIAVSAAGGHTLGLKSDGTVVAWGYNFFEQTNVPAGLSGVVAVSAGAGHSLALKANGTVVAWGNNGNLQSTVPAGLSGVVAISAGGTHSLALKNDGTVVAWGSSSNGQITVPAGLSGVTQIAAGYFHSMALKDDGSVVTWGKNNYGQTTPPSSLSRVSAISANEHGLAVSSAVFSITVAEDSGTYNEESFAVGVTPGTGDVGQTVSIICTNSNNDLFSTQPAIAADGTLTFTPAADASGTSTVTVIATDNTGLTSVAQIFIIEVTPVADPPVMGLPTTANVSAYSATFRFDFISLGDAEIQGSGFIYAPVSANATLVYYGDGVTTSPSMGGNEVFVSNLLASGTPYNLRSYAYGPAGMVYSEVSTFTTQQGAATLLDNTAGLSSPLGGGGYNISSSRGFGYKITTGNQAVTVSSISVGLNSSAAFCLRFRLYECGADSLPVGEPLNEYYDDSRLRFLKPVYATVPMVGWQLSANHSYVVMVDNTSGTATAVWRTYDTSRPFVSSSGWTADAVVERNGNEFSTVNATNDGFSFQMTGALVETPPTYTHQELWRFANFGSYASENTAVDAADPDGDGLNNLLEYALGLNPNASGVIPATVALNGANLEYTYTRSTAAKDNGAVYQIEWSDTLAAGSWSAETVTEQIQGSQGALETVKASVPAGSGGKRFLRLRVSK